MDDCQILDASNTQTLQLLTLASPKVVESPFASTPTIGSEYEMSSVENKRHLLVDALVRSDTEDFVIRADVQLDAKENLKGICKSGLEGTSAQIKAVKKMTTNTAMGTLALSKKENDHHSLIALI